jgi:hypothetical protein
MAASADAGIEAATGIDGRPRQSRRVARFLTAVLRRSPTRNARVMFN